MQQRIQFWIGHEKRISFAFDSTFEGNIKSDDGNYACHVHKEGNQQSAYVYELGICILEISLLS